MKSFHRLLVLLTAAFACTSATVSARTPADALRLANTGLHREVLDNGMVCVVKADPSAKVASVQIWIRTGSIHEQEFLGGGLSHYVEHMIFKGTERRGATEITRDINEAGGRVNAYTTMDRVVIYCTLPSENWATGFDVLSDAVMNSTFPESEWKNESDVILREFAMGRDDPRRVMSKLLFDTAYRVHPYRVPVIGYEDVFKSMGRDELTSFFKRHYVPNNMITVVVGDVDPDAVMKELRETYGSWPRAALAPVVLPREPAQQTRRVARKEGAYSVSRLRWAAHITNLSDADTPALDMLAAVVGQGLSSRMNVELKETRKLAHEIGAWSYTPLDPGLFTVSATFDSERETELIAAIEEQVTGWATAEFTEAELAKARRMVISAELSELQTCEGQASGYGSSEFYTGNPRYAERYIAELDTVTPADLRRVAAKYLDVERASLALLTPESEDPPASAEAANALTKAPARRLLATGVPLIVREDRRLPFVHVSVVFGGGLLSETEAKNGITEMMGQLLLRGTVKRSAAEIAAQVDAWGASLTAFAGRNSFGVQGRCLSSDVDAFLYLVGECLAGPTFADVEVEKQRTLQLAAIDRERERPFDIAASALRGQLFPAHPYRFSPQGTPQSVKALTREALRAHYTGLAVSGNLVIALFGDIDADAAQSLANRNFDFVPEGEAYRPPDFDSSATVPGTVKTTAPKEQVIYLAGFPGLSVDDPSYDDMNVLGRAMSGMASDLSTELRDKRGLVYYSGASQLTGRQPGMFFVYAGTRPDAVDQVDALVKVELERVAGTGLREDEVERARRQLLSQRQEDLQDGAGLAMATALDELYGLGYRRGFDLEARLARVTTSSVQTLAKRLLDPNRRATVILMPEATDQ